MAETRLRTISIISWLALAIAAVIFTVTGLSQAGIDQGAWISEALLWVTAITLVSLLSVPAPSGSRISLGIGAIVAASILTQEVTAFAAATAAALAIAWVFQRRIDTWSHRTDGDFLSDALAAAVFGATYVYMEELFLGWGLSDDAWTVVGAVAIGGLAWFIVRALVAAFVGVERTDLAGRYLWLLALEDWAVVVSILAAGTLFGLTWPVMNVWAFAVAVLPYAFGHLAFERYHQGHLRTDDSSPRPDPRGRRPRTSRPFDAHG